jgi:hypothetical protein
LWWVRQRESTLNRPRRVLRYMQDAELHALLYGKRKLATTAVI